MAHAGEYASDQHRRKAGREDEARRVAADDINDHLVSSDIAAHHPECLAERAFDDAHTVRNVITVSNAAAARAIHADGVNFVAIGERVIGIGKIAYCGDWRDIAVH